MPRVFTGLAIANLILFAGTAGLGLVGGPAARPDRHILLAVVSLLITCFVQVVVFTYFTVTGKLIVQALQLGHSDLAPLHTAKKSKRSVTRWLGAVGLAVVLVTATGGTHWRSQDAGAIHMAAAAWLVFITTLALAAQFRLVAQNAAMLKLTMEAYVRQRDNSATDGGSSQHGHGAAGPSANRDP